MASIPTPGSIPLVGAVSDRLTSVDSLCYSDCVMIRPDPHPLDFDWRFDAASTERLAGHARNGRTLLLGCPSVAEAIARNERDVTLIDWQPLPDASNRIEHIQADLRSDKVVGEGGQFDTVIIDSPWYIDYLKPWLEQARHGVRTGGLIMFSLWPPETRPSAAAEARDILEFASFFGPCRLESSALRYVTPSFELQSAAVSGRVVSDRWRYGDLATVDVSNRSNIMPARDGHRDRSRSIWHRYVFDKQQIALRVPNRLLKKYRVWL